MEYSRPGDRETPCFMGNENAEGQSRMQFRRALRFVESRIFNMECTVSLWMRATLNNPAIVAAGCDATEMEWGDGQQDELRRGRISAYSEPPIPNVLPHVARKTDPRHLPLNNPLVQPRGFAMQIDMPAVPTSSPPVPLVQLHAFAPRTEGTSKRDADGEAEGDKGDETGNTVSVR
ncbi:hypothetical protein HDU93_004367 [Gonapodya sp. JEL0774]|nr:hypothetical protein HDU93_004367 [Gonapodya sp. JEL0774]